MKLLKKISICTGLAVLLATNVVADTYTVQSGDSLMKIVYKLGFDSIEAAGIKSVPSGNINLIFVGDEIGYKSKHKKKSRFKSKEKIDLDKFCFKSNRSIHYRASQRCVPNRFDTKKKVVRKVRKKKDTSSH